MQLSPSYQRFKPSIHMGYCTLCGEFNQSSQRGAQGDDGTTATTATTTLVVPVRGEQLGVDQRSVGELRNMAGNVCHPTLSFVIPTSVLCFHHSAEFRGRCWRPMEFLLVPALDHIIIPQD